MSKTTFEVFAGGRLKIEADAEKKKYSVIETQCNINAPSHIYRQFIDQDGKWTELGVKEYLHIVAVGLAGFVASCREQGIKSEQEIEQMFQVALDEAIREISNSPFSYKIKPTFSGEN